jgi:hypothetical protein
LESQLLPAHPSSMITHARHAQTLTKSHSSTAIRICSSFCAKSLAVPLGRRTRIPWRRSLRRLPYLQAARRPDWVNTNKRAPLRIAQAASHQAGPDSIFHVFGTPSGPQTFNSHRLCTGTDPSTGVTFQVNGGTPSFPSISRLRNLRPSPSALRQLALTMLCPFGRLDVPC